MRKYQDGGEQPQELSPVQVEKGEKILLPSLSLVNTAAKKKHSQMKDSLVTDLLPQNSYIFSDTKKMKINKNSYLAGQRIGDISLGYEAVDYQENESVPMPKEITFGDLIKKMKFTPAEYAQRINNKFPTTERERDSFANKANEENKMSRVPYLEILTQISEVLRAKNQPQENSNMQMYGGVPGYKYGGYISQFKHGGGIHIKPENKGKFNATKTRTGKSTEELTHSSNPVTKKRAIFAQNAAKWHHKTGGFIPPKAQFGFLGDVVKGIFGEIARSSENDRIDQARAYETSIVNNNYDQNKAFNENITNAGYLQGLSPLLQDPRYTVGNYDQQISGTASTYDNLIARQEAEKKSAQDLALSSSNSVIRNMSSLGLSPSQSANYVNQLHTSGLNSANESNLKTNQGIGVSMQQRLAGLNHYYDIKSGENKDKANVERTNRNKISETLYTNPFKTYIGSQNRLQSLNNDKANALLSIYGTTNNALTQNNQFANRNLGNTLGNLADRLYQPTPMNNNGNPASTGYGNYGIPEGPSSPYYNPNDPYYQPNDPYDRSMYGKYGGYLAKLKKKFGGKIK